MSDMRHVASATATAASEANAIYVSDLDRCVPASGVSTSPRRFHWRLIPYATEAFTGSMLVASHETEAPEVSYPLRVTGWHRISLGVYQERWDEIESFQVRLTDDPAFCVITVPSGPQWVFHDVYWKTADLTDQEVIFRQLSDVWDGPDRPGVTRRPAARARIAYIKLEPLTAEGVAAYRVDVAGPEHRTLYAHDDAHGYMWLWGVRDAMDIKREIEPYRDTDFSRLYWEAAMGDILYYLGSTGHLPTCDGVDDFQNSGGRVHAENWRWFRESGLDPLRVAAEFAHEIGLELHASYRPAGFNFPPPEDQWNAGGFDERHPELRGVNRDGSIQPRTSYAFPETRAYVLSVLREVASYPVDGIAMVYIRRPPLVGYEPPIVDSFRAATGLDAFELPADDERWLRHRCGVLTEFHRDLRRLLDEVARERGLTKPLAITAMVSGIREENLRHGMDVEQWIADGTVDTLIPYTMAPELDSAAESFPDPEAARWWVEITRGTNTTLSLSILPRWKSPDDYYRKAAELYDVGGESLFFWDCGGQRVNFMDQNAWNAMRRLGHREEVLGAVRRGTPMSATTHEVRQIGGYDMSFGTPG